MKKRWIIAIVLAVLAVGGAVSYGPAAKYLKQRNRPKWRLAQVERGEIVSVRNSSGSVKPVLSVQIGSFVSGPITELLVDFNDRVKKDQVLAKIDPRIYDAAVKRDKAVLATAQAEVNRAKAVLEQARNNEVRSIALRAESEDFISDTEMDQYKFNRMSLEAQLELAEASVDQALGSLENSLANLGYTEIKSPVDGIVIDRKIDEGQTLAAQFQTPELFVIAPDMEKKMHVFASVDEADIGYIRQAQLEGRPVYFTVDAYLDDLFEGKIEQIRMSSTTTQNVVTYPVVVAASNEELKLFPGMTANISFEVGRKADVVKIPNGALRFYPLPEHVHPDDRKILEGTVDDDEEQFEPADEMLSAMEKAAARQERNRRHVWIDDGLYLRAVEVVTGVNDTRFTELVSGELAEGQKLVTGIEAKINF